MSARDAAFRFDLAIVGAGYVPVLDRTVIATFTLDEHRRMDRLVHDGIIRRFTIEVDHVQLGISLEAFTELTFSGDTRVDVIASVGHGIPEVQRVFTMAGDPDAVAWLRVRDVADLQRVVDLLRAGGQVTGTKTMIVLQSSAGDPP